LTVAMPDAGSNLHDAHRRSANHRDDVLMSDVCGCFYCRSVFGPDKIREWVDKDDSGVPQTALCPHCGIDSVLGSASGFPIDHDFLSLMRTRYFGTL